MDEIPIQSAIVGQQESTHWACVFPIIKRALSQQPLREFSGFPELIESASAGEFFPDLVVVCQEYRDEFAPEIVQQALAVLPLARWICVLGAWCESEGRHGSHWPDAVRLRSPFLETRLALEIEVLQGRQTALTFTAAREEIFEFDTQRPLPRLLGELRVVTIIGPDRELTAWLSDLCESAGFQVKPLETETAPSVIVLDLDPLTETTKQRLGPLKTQHPTAKIVGLLGLVQAEDVRELRQAGADAVLSKLTPATQLLNEISRMSQN